MIPQNPKIDYASFEMRKVDHIHLAQNPQNQADNMNYLDQLRFLHEAIPDFDFEDISLVSRRLGQEVSTPFFVSSMTAGHIKSQDINRNLIEACAATGWAMGVGSQRRELSDTDAGQEWQSLRRAFPDVVLLSNIGITQIIHTSTTQIQKLIESLQATALIVHCNPLQEVIQPEGTPQFKGAWQALERLVRELPVPIIVKETGCGFSAKTMTRLRDCGVSVIDVSGLGGTHWGRIEGHRASENSMQQQAALVFQNWGITSIESLQYARSFPHTLELWGSGGVRHGLDAAKLLALGATSIGFAKPLLEAALQSSQSVYEKMKAIEFELRIALFCTGSREISALGAALCPSV
ncbi:MAG: type 2 isopentenyl-diphosphate Delta-isomerase [Legionellaceae bacterium]|nr:type 2 isopentenyl-diphosphate Delta-isomerase [Legionellaceae bacterium]